MLVPKPFTTFWLRAGAYWRVGLLALVSALVWIGHYDRWTLASWSIPTDYRGDALEILTRIQAAAEGDAVPLRPQLITRLGAPFGANWSAYPSSDLLLIWALGQMARVIGVFPAANLAMLLAAVSAALAFYGCARWLRVRWEWAFATALLFAFTFQAFGRGLPHLFFLFSWTVPLALLACGLVAGSKRLRPRGWGGAFCFGTALIVGIGNPYTLFLFLQLLGWALLAQWFGPRRRENLLVGVAALALAIGAFFVVESHVWLFAPDTAATSPLVRNYGGTERYALKPLELVLPPASHRWDALAFFGHRYQRWSEWRSGEAGLPYLGLVGITGLGWLAATAVIALLRRRPLPRWALPTGWVLAFASIGGLTNIFAFFSGLVVFRATNRFSLFIAAIVLLFLAQRLSRWWSGRARWPSVATAAIVAAVGLFDQLPRAPGLEKQERIARRIEADQALGKMLEGRLPANAMVFQMPVMMFPEVPPTHQLGDYEHFRPYLATNSLRFSYGMLKGRSRGNWQRETDELSTANFVRRLERYGFAALYFDRRGFEDRGEKLLGELAEMGRERYLESPDGEQVVVFLEPSPNPELPMARRLTFGRGWHAPRRGEPRWAYGPAAFSYFNPYREAVRAEVRLVVSSVGERHLAITFNDDERFERRIAGERQELTLSLRLRPGINRFDLETREPAVRLSQQRGQLRAFGVHETSVRPQRNPARAESRDTTEHLE